MRFTWRLLTINLTHEHLYQQSFKVSNVLSVYKVEIFETQIKGGGARGRDEPRAMSLIRRNEETHTFPLQSDFLSGRGNYSVRVDPSSSRTCCVA